MLCALDGVDQNAVNNDGKTALDVAVSFSKVDCVRALLEFNVDTCKARVMANTNVEIVQLLDEHRKRSVKKNKINLFLIAKKMLSVNLFIFRKLNELQVVVECFKNNA